MSSNAFLPRNGFLQTNRMWSDTGSSARVNPLLPPPHSETRPAAPFMIRDDSATAGRCCRECLEMRRLSSPTNSRKWTGAGEYLNWDAPPPPESPSWPWPSCYTNPMSAGRLADLQQLSECLCFVCELILNTRVDGRRVLLVPRLIISPEGASFSRVSCVLFQEKGDRTA